MPIPTSDPDFNPEEIRIQEALRAVQEVPQPSAFVKQQLDAAWKRQHAPRGFFRLRMPVYQSVAAVTIFLIVGFSLGAHREKTPLRAQTVVKWKEKIVPVEKTIRVVRYVRVPTTVPTNPQTVVDPGTMPSAVGPIMAASDTHSAIDYANGISFADDTLLQRMAVTLY